MEKPMDPHMIQNLSNAFGALHFAMNRLISHTATLAPDPAAFSQALKAEMLRGIADIAPRNSTEPQKEEILLAWQTIIAGLFPPTTPAPPPQPPMHGR
jgi:hypothetical protein